MLKKATTAALILTATLLMLGCGDPDPLANNNQGTTGGTTSGTTTGGTGGTTGTTTGGTTGGTTGNPVSLSSLTANFTPGTNPAPNINSANITTLDFWQSDFDADSLDANLQNGGNGLNSVAPGLPSRRIQINVDNGSTIQAGQSIPISSGTGANQARVLFVTREFPADFGIWSATAGTLRITEVNGNIITLVGENVVCRPATGGVQGNAVGTFTFNFTTRVDKTIDKLL